MALVVLALLTNRKDDYMFGDFYGKGINDMPKGWYSACELNKRTYHCWHHMLARCYSDEIKNHRPTYVDCYVCDRWLLLSNFVEDIVKIEGYDYWLSHPHEKVALDKDIKSNGENKCYCLEQCLFVTVTDNVKQANKKLVGKKKSEETKEKISNTLKGKFSGENHPLARAVVGVNIKNGNIIQYKYATEANKDGFSSRHISSCCRGNRKTHKGYKWYYADEYYRGEK